MIEQIILQLFPVALISDIIVSYSLYTVSRRTWRVFRFGPRGYKAKTVKGLSFTKQMCGARGRGLAKRPTNSTHHAALHLIPDVTRGKRVTINTFIYTLQLLSLCIMSHCRTSKEAVTYASVRDLMRGDCRPLPNFALLSSRFYPAWHLRPLISIDWGTVGY